MMRSLYSGVSGLKNHQTRMDVIGNNIANVNTAAFKASRTVFVDVYSQTVRTSSAGSPNGVAEIGEVLGGTNPSQIGLGVKLGSVDILFTSGATQRTDNPTDLAISGDGFFVIDTNGIAGASATDIRMMDSANEAYFLAQEGAKRFYDTAMKAANTTDDRTKAQQAYDLLIGIIKYGYNTQIGDDGISFKTEMPTGFETLGTYQADAKVTVNNQNGNTQILADADAEGVTAGEAAAPDLDTLADDVDTARQDLADAKAENPPVQADIDAANNALTAALAAQKLAQDAYNAAYKAAKEQYLKDNPLTPVTQEAINKAAKEAAQADWENFQQELADTQALPQAQIQDPSNGELMNVDAMQKAVLTLVDKMFGTAVGQMTSMGGNSTNATDWENVDDLTDYEQFGDTNAQVIAKAKLEAAEAISKLLGMNGFENIQTKIQGIYSPQGNGGMQYTRAGNFYMDSNGFLVTSEGNMLMGYEAVPSVDHLNNKIIGVENENGTIEYPGALKVDSAQPIFDVPTDAEQNDVTGAAAGSKLRQINISGFVSVSIDSQGIVWGLDTASNRVPIAKIAMAMFSNNTGLEKIGNSNYQKTAAAGAVVYTTAKDDGAGDINPGGLEMSNVDLATEFTDMIVTQRGFQANSRIITVSDTMLEELVNLKR
jgi:flagellar hook protein FlgE